MKRTLLWTNSNPTSALGTTTFGDVSDFDYIQVTLRFSTSVSTTNTSILTKDVNGSAAGVGTTNVTNRTFYTSAAGILSCGNGLVNGYTTNDSYGIPVSVYGIKGKIN